MKEPELFNERWAIFIRKMISKNHYIMPELSGYNQRFAGSGTAFKGIPSPIKKFFQRASKWSVSFNEQNAISNMHITPPLVEKARNLPSSGTFLESFISTISRTERFGGRNLT
jgi:hypothetical protein